MKEGEGTVLPRRLWISSGPLRDGSSVERRGTGKPFCEILSQPAGAGDKESEAMRVSDSFYRLRFVYRRKGEYRVPPGLPQRGWRILMKAFRALHEGRPVPFMAGRSVSRRAPDWYEPARYRNTIPFRPEVLSRTQTSRLTVSAMPTVCQMIPPPKRRGSSRMVRVFRTRQRHMAAMMAPKGYACGMEISGDDQVSEDMTMKAQPNFAGHPWRFSPAGDRIEQGAGSACPKRRKRTNTSTLLRQIDQQPIPESPSRAVNPFSVALADEALQPLLKRRKRCPWKSEVR